MSQLHNFMWTREEAFWVIERLEPELDKIGAHCALAGGVLVRGGSEKDLDLIIYPHESNLKFDLFVRNRFKIENVLKTFFKADKFNTCEATSQIRDDKSVAWIKTPKGKRVDFFFLE